MPTRFGEFDFGLAAPEEARARLLHDTAIIIDALFWGPVTYRGYPAWFDAALRDAEAAAIAGTGRDWDGRALGFRLAAAGEFGELRAIWDATGVTVGQYEIAVGSAESLLHFATHLSYVFDRLPWLRKALRASDIEQAKSDGGHAMILHCQPSEPVARDLRLLDSAYDLGLRVLQLTYNVHDLIGAGCTDRSGSGLSDFGVRVVQHLNQLGVLVDTSHCSERTILDACAVSAQPVIASHTAAAALNKHDRCMSDEALRAIAETGGTIGIVTVPFFLSRGEKVTIEAMLDHIDYVSELVGPEHVAIGSDWPLGEPSFAVERFVNEWVPQHGFRPEHNVTGDNLIGFDDYRDFPNITRGLVARGYTDDQIHGILGENFLRVFRTVCG